MEQCLALLPMTVLVPGAAVLPDLCDMSRHRLPAFYLARIDFRKPSAHIVPRIPLKPATWIVLFVDPLLSLPLLEWLTCINSKMIERHRMPGDALGVQSRTSKPTLWKLFSAITKIATTKYTQCEHFFWAEVWGEISSESPPRLCDDFVSVRSLHLIMYVNEFFSVHKRTCGLWPHGITLRSFHQSALRPLLRQLLCDVQSHHGDVVAYRANRASMDQLRY